MKGNNLLAAAAVVSGVALAVGNASAQQAPAPLTAQQLQSAIKSFAAGKGPGSYSFKIGASGQVQPNVATGWYLTVCWTSVSYWDGTYSWEVSYNYDGSAYAWVTGGTQLSSMGQSLIDVCRSRHGYYVYVYNSNGAWDEIQQQDYY